MMKINMASIIHSSSFSILTNKRPLDVSVFYRASFSAAPWSELDPILSQLRRVRRMFGHLTPDSQNS